MTDSFANSADSSMLAGGFRPRRSSYAAVVSGSAATSSPAHQQSARRGALTHLLNDDSIYNSEREPHRAADMSSARYDEMPGGWGAWDANGQLPVYSRRFADLLNTYASEGHAADPFDHFFVPSYLKGSKYARGLEAAHQAEVAAAKENPQGQTSQPRSLSTSSSSANLAAKAPTSHRGVTFDLIEKTPPVERLPTLPLPSKWNTLDKHAGIEVLSDGCEAKLTSTRPATDREHEAYSIRADHAMPSQCGIYYFEVAIMSRRREESSICIGFSGREVPLSRPPGWEPNSWAYHGDDGNSFCFSSSGKNYGPTYTTDDVIGCGVNFADGSVFFTKNGVNLGVAFRDVKGKLFPSVGMKRSGEHVRVNFGQTPFVFDVDGLVTREKLKIENDVASTSTSKLAPPMNETELIQLLVLQYLTHDGYVESAKAFAEEVHSEQQALTSGDAPGSKSKYVEDKNALNRKEIRRAIVDGDVDKAMNLTSEYFPDVLANETIYFRLRCHRFIELIQQAAAVHPNATKQQNKSNGHYGDWYDEIANQQSMDLDTPDGTNGVDKMDTDSPFSKQTEYNVLLEETINYGRDLQVEFDGHPDPDVKRDLHQAFGLMAYEDPANSPEVSFLLAPERRVELAESVNSAILKSQGKPPTAAIERLVQQTNLLVEDLSVDSGPGCYINVDDYVKPKLIDSSF